MINRKEILSLCLFILFFLNGCGIKDLKGKKKGHREEIFHSLMQEREFNEEELRILTTLCSNTFEKDEFFYDDFFSKTFHFSLEGKLCGLHQPKILVKTRPNLRGDQLIFFPIDNEQNKLDVYVAQFLEMEPTLNSLPLKSLCQKQENKESISNTQELSNNKKIQYSLNRNSDSIHLTVSTAKRQGHHTFSKYKEETYSFRSNSNSSSGKSINGMAVEKEVRQKCSDNKIGKLSRKLIEIL